MNLLKMNYWFGSFFLVLFALCSNQQNPVNDMSTTDFYDLSILSLEETDTIHFSDFKGKKVLLVNVASRCGFTYQYADLQKLHEKYKDEMVIIGFPCNQFLFQEPGNKDSIRTFCSSKYGVTFPLSTKIKVKGDSIHPVYEWLTTKDLNGFGDFKVSWNFNKFLVNEEGQLVAYFGSKTEPFDPELIKAIEN